MRYGFDTSVFPVNRITKEEIHDQQQGHFALYHIPILLFSGNP